MPINLFNMLIASRKITQANSYWREKRRQNACNTAIAAKIVVGLETLICRS